MITPPTFLHTIIIDIYGRMLGWIKIAVILSGLCSVQRLAR